MSGTRARQCGLTLAALLIALCLVAVLSALAVPAWRGQVERHRLAGGIAAVYGAFSLARHEAVSTRRAVVFSFLPETDATGWCYVLTSDPSCDCRAARCASPSGPARPVQARDLAGLSLRVLPRNGRIHFYPGRGTTSAGSVELTVGAASARVVVSSLGRVRICSSADPAYPPCR